MERQNDDVSTLQTLCAEQEIVIDLLTLQQLVRYGDCLERWNRKINLISRKEDAPVIIKHIFHSLLICRYHSFREGEHVLDLGTGGKQKRHLYDSPFFSRNASGGHLGKAMSRMMLSKSTGKEGSRLLKLSRPSGMK